ncbi:hypothetical protein NJL88_29420 [Streptomyces sp. DK15]|uniref:hypothetical protein n=1 Tax=Streptomyces sp. DK15 TaxID=2957499 RepID=UPI0029AB6018|nr:hypothetical protein [Streptomyces sp. DK15]MDX2394108.1 hypothetical protein [Streptomyces sp. DK15]
MNRERVPLTPSQRGEAAALAAVRLHISTHLPPGQQIGGSSTGTAAAELSSLLRRPVSYVAAALRELSVMGIVAPKSSQVVVVLAPDQPHPQDQELQEAVRERISSGFYPEESALPTGLLGDEFGLRADLVARACRYLTRDGTLRYDPHGRYGSGFYVTKTGATAAVRAGTTVGGIQ